MQQADCMDLLNELEAALPVAEWRGGGVNAWPIVRSRIFFELTGTQHGAAPASLPRALARAAAETGAGLTARGRQRLLDRAHEAKTGPADVLFLGDPASRVLVDGRWFDRHCDPLADVLDQMGLRTLHLEPLHRYLWPRHRASRPIQSSLDLERVRSRVRSAPPVDLPGHAELLQRLAAHGPVPGSVSREAVVHQVHVIAAMASRFDRTLASTRPRLVAVVDYGSTSMACHVACRRAGVPSIDLQHGLQGPLHFAYARWQNCPADGYAELARYFWVWSAHEAAAIDEWGAATGRHEAVVGGDPWLQMWSDDTSSLVQRYDAHLAALIGGADAQRQVLVTLRWGVDPRSLAALLAAARASPDLRWWLRDHPGSTPVERRSLAAALAPDGRLLADSRAATELPLPALLRHMDVHVTHNSSAVIEAAAFGVPSVLTDPTGLDYFPQETAAGLAQRVDGVDLPAAVARAADAHPRVARPARMLPDLRREVLTELVG